MQLHEAESIISKLRASAEECRHRLGEEVTLRDKERVAHKEAVTRLEARVELAENVSRAGEEQVASASAQLQQRDKQVAKLQERLRDLEQELGRTTTEYRTLRSNMDEERRRSSEESDSVSWPRFIPCPSIAERLTLHAKQTTAPTR